MQEFSTHEAALDVVRALPGYVPSLRDTDKTVYEEDDDFVHKGCYWEYAQAMGTDHKLRHCLILTRADKATGALTYWLSLPAVNETVTGMPVTAQDYAGEGAYAPWIQSCYGWMKRDGSQFKNGRGSWVNTTPHKLDLTPWVDGTDAPELKAFYKASFTFDIVAEMGFQALTACWARCNEGDFVSVFVDIPLIWITQDPGHVGWWHEHAQFGEELTVFGTNEAGTHYPPVPNPRMSTLLSGVRVRIVFYKKAVNDPVYALGEGETEENTPAKRGPFIDLDIQCQKPRT